MQCPVPSRHSQEVFHVQVHSPHHPQHRTRTDGQRRFCASGCQTRPGVDATAFKKVKLLISDALYKGTIDYFDVYGYGKEGGFSSCMEKGRFAVEGSFENFLKALRAIKPNRATTAYSVNEVTLCTYPTNTLP